MNESTIILLGATTALVGILVIYFITKKTKKENTPESEPIDRLTPIPFDIRGSNPWTGDDIIANFLRLCRQTKPSAIVLGFVSNGLTRPGLLTTGEYTSRDDIPDEITDQIERAEWARQFDINRSGDERLFNSWLSRMVRRLKAEADAHFKNNIPGPMEIPDWLKSVLDFAVASQGVNKTVSEVTKQINNVAGEASDGHAKGTATFGALTVQIRVYIDGLGKKAARRQSSFAIQKQ